MRARPAARPARSALHAPWALACAALAALALAGPAAAAPDAQQWAQEPRTVVAWPSADGFVVRSERDSAAGSDLLTAAYDSATARLDVGFNATRPGPAGVASSLTVLAVWEFRDQDGDGRYGLGEPVVRRVEVPGTPATASTQARPGGVWRATALHTLAPGVLEVQLEARPAPAGSLDPTRLDLRVALQGVRAGNGTHLAIEAVLESNVQHEALSADLVRLRDGNHTLATGWDPSTSGHVMEGTDPLRVTLVRSAAADDRVAYDGAVTAAWAPQPAQRSLPFAVPTGSLPIYLGAAFVTLAALAIPAWRRLRGLGPT